MGLETIAAGVQSKSVAGESLTRERAVNAPLTARVEASNIGVEGRDRDVHQTPVS